MPPSMRLVFFQAEDGIRDVAVTGVQTCALPISNHEHDRAPGGSFGENVCRTARAESRLTARAAKSARKVCGFAALQQHHNHKNKAVQNKEGFQDPGAAPGEAEANPDDRESDGQRDGPFHPRRHFYLLTNPKYFGTDSSNLSRRQFVACYREASTMVASDFASRLAPPTNAPSSSSCAISPRILSGFTLPP